METRSERFGLVRYSSGDDSPSRLDWEETVAALDSLAALDRGTVTAPTPLVDQKKRRFAFRDWGTTPGWWGSQGMRTLYRSDDDLVDWPIGGPTHPRTQDFRALDNQTPSAPAWRVSHPDRTAGPTVETRYDGSSRWAGRLSVHDPNWDPTAGRNPATVHIGSDVAADAKAFGRLYVRTVADEDRGIVVQGHSDKAGPAVVVREPGGADMHWVDPFGRVRTKTATALGGTELAADALTRALTVSPSTDPTGVGGTLLHGRSTRGAVDPLTVRRFEPGATGDLPMLRVGTRDVEVGSSDMADPDARLRLSAPLIVGQGEWRQYLTGADRTGSASTMRAQGLAADSAWSTVPSVVDNRGLVTATPQTVRAYTSGGTVPAPRLATWRTFRPGASTEDKVMAYVDTTGAMGANAAWRSTDSDRPVAIRDVRQAIMHRTTQRWVLPGHFGLYRGLKIEPGDRSATFEFPTMRVRSSTATNLLWRMRLEALTYAADPPFQGLDRVVINLTFAISINGGTWQRVEDPGWEMETVGMTTSPVSYVPGDSSTYPGAWMNALQPGDTFKIRFTARNSDGLGPMRLRRADLDVQECIVENYAQPNPQPLGYDLTETQRQASIWSPN